MIRVRLVRPNCAVALFVAVLAVACAGGSAASPSPQATPPVSPLAATTVPGCIDCIVRVDPVLTISFATPRAFSYSPARPAQTTEIVLTETARLSSYPIELGPRDPANDVLIELFLAPRKGEDLATIAATRFSVTPSTARPQSLAGHPALRLEGDFQSGRRVFVLLELDAQRVLVMSAFPATAGRIGDFERLLQTLEVR